MRRRYWITVMNMEAYNKTKGELQETEVFIHVQDDLVNAELEVKNHWRELSKDDWYQQLGSRRVVDETKDMEIFYLREEECRGVMS